MAFPTNPTDGQMHNGYTYNSAKGAWIIINEYDSEGNLDINRDVEINGTLNIIDSETRNTTESSSNYATPLLINGTPIVESGSNSDGEWTRWADGTQICFTGPEWHAEYYGRGEVWTYPVTFNETPVLVGSAATRNVESEDVEVVQFGVSGNYYATKTDTEVAHTSTRLEAFSSTLIAIGKWK